MVVVIFGGGLIKFLGFSEEVEARHDKIYRSVFEPYWSALRRGRVTDAMPYRTDSWNAVNDGEDLREAYRLAEEKHGALNQPVIKKMRAIKRAGQSEEVMRIESFFEFEDGWKGIVVYKLRRDKPGQPWKIDQSITDPENPLGEGPF